VMPGTMKGGEGDKMNGDTEAEHGESESEIFDFLYYDARRVVSYLGQLDSSGHLQQVKKSDSAGTSIVNKFGASAGASIPLIMEGKGNFDRQSTEEKKDSFERTYDPFWHNALRFLKFLEEQNLVKTDMSRARIRQFVLHSGLLSIVNLAIFQPVWAVSAFKERLIREHRAALSVHIAEIVRSGLPAGISIEDYRQFKENEADITLGLLPQLPHSVQATIINQESQLSAWCNLADEGIVGSSADFALKHGDIIPGEWHVLGILDGMPGAMPPMLPVAENISFGEQLNYGNIARNLSRLARQALGRPTNSYAMTPLMIFRAVLS
jgi:hypothetical protein